MKQDRGRLSSCGLISLTLCWLQPRLAPSKLPVLKWPDKAEWLLEKPSFMLFFIVFFGMWWKTLHTEMAYSWFLQCLSSTVGMSSNALKTQIVLRELDMFAEMTKTDNTYDDAIVIYIVCKNGHWSPVMGNKAKRSPSVLSSGWALPKASTSESCLLDSHLHLCKNTFDKWNHGKQLLGLLLSPAVRIASSESEESVFIFFVCLLFKKKGTAVRFWNV